MYLPVGGVPWPLFPFAGLPSLFPCILLSLAVAGFVDRTTHTRAGRRCSVPGALETLQRTHRLLPTLLEELEEYHASTALHYGAAVSVFSLVDPAPWLVLQLAVSCWVFVRAPFSRDCVLRRPCRGCRGIGLCLSLLCACACAWRGFGDCKRCMSTAGASMIFLCGGCSLFFFLRTGLKTLPL